MNNKNVIVFPLVSYSNAKKDKAIIYQENRNKSGIYRWNNLITGKSYIGSSKSLSKRFTNYYSLNFIKKKVETESSIIYNSILKYGYNNFSLDILEYCESNLLLKREQYYLDILKPEYNILKIAGSNLGFKLTEETKLKISISKIGLKHDIPFSINLSKAKRGKKHNKPRITNNTTPRVMTVESRLKLSKNARGVCVKIFDKNNNFINQFPNLKTAAEYLGVDSSTLGNIYKTGISYDDYIYKFEAKDLRVWVYDSNNKLINIMDNITKTSLFYKIPPTTMYRYIKSGKLFNNKYYFYVK